MLIYCFPFYSKENVICVPYTSICGCLNMHWPSPLRTGSCCTSTGHETGSHSTQENTRPTIKIEQHAYWCLPSLPTLPGAPTTDRTRCALSQQICIAPGAKGHEFRNVQPCKSPSTSGKNREWKRTERDYEAVMNNPFARSCFARRCGSGFSVRSFFSNSNYNSNPVRSTCPALLINCGKRWIERWRLRLVFHVVLRRSALSRSGPTGRGGRTQKTHVHIEWLELKLQRAITYGKYTEGSIFSAPVCRIYRYFGILYGRIMAITPFISP